MNSRNSERSILAVGDVMLDCYLEGQVRRISPEAPVPVVTLGREWSLPGGVGNVAASLAGLDCRVTLAGIVGNDADSERLRGVLRGAGVAELALVARDELRTVVKTRVVADGQQQLLRIDRDGDRAAYQAASKALTRIVLPLVGEHDAVVLSDYDKGAVSEELCRAVISECRRRAVPCIVDPKKADFSVYAQATLITPNLGEAARALRSLLTNDDQVAAAARSARDELGIDHFVITRGAEGMTLATAEGTFHFPAEVREVADVTGAGDTVVAVLARSLGARDDMKEACRLASLAAGIAVGHRGCYVVRSSELERARSGRSLKIMEPDGARHWVERHQQAGRKVVFTNGCFDLLHAGHLTSLERARGCGDALIVGLNSDASVRANKGASRPILSEEQRAALLAGLACVDAVVIFNEETPEGLVRTLCPDVLAKGQDYEGRSVAGAEFVRERGGKVVLIPLVEGLSTTAILAKGAAHHEPARA